MKTKCNKSYPFHYLYTGGNICTWHGYCTELSWNESSTDPLMNQNKWLFSLLKIGILKVKLFMRTMSQKSSKKGFLRYIVFCIKKKRLFLPIQKINFHDTLSNNSNSKNCLKDTHSHIVSTSWKNFWPAPENFMVHRLFIRYLLMNITNFSRQLKILIALSPWWKIPIKQLRIMRIFIWSQKCNKNAFYGSQ